MMPAHSSGAASSVGEPVRDPVGERRWYDDVLGVAAVGVPAGVRRPRAQVLRAAAAPAARARRCCAARRRPPGRRRATPRHAPRPGRRPRRRPRGRARPPGALAAGRRRRSAGRCGTPRTPAPGPAPRPGSGRRHGPLDEPQPVRRPRVPADLPRLHALRHRRRGGGGASAPRCPPPQRGPPRRRPPGPSTLRPPPGADGRLGTAGTTPAPRYPRTPSAGGQQHVCRRR